MVAHLLQEGRRPVAYGDVHFVAANVAVATLFLNESIYRYKCFRRKRQLCRVLLQREMTGSGMLSLRQKRGCLARLKRERTESDH